MVEATANSIEDFLVDGLSFKLKKGASYINERKSVTYHPSGSNIYSTSGTKLIKLLITGDNWLDPSTFRVMFDLVNMESDEQFINGEVALNCIFAYIKEGVHRIPALFFFPTKYSQQY